MIKAEKLSYSTADCVLFTDSDFTLLPGQHCALIGTNGAGKTTLLDMILHREDYLYKGKLIIDGVERFGYINQFSAADKYRRVSVFDYLCGDFRQMQKRMDELCGRMETEPDNERLMDEYQRCMDEYMAVDGYDHEVNVRRELRTAGLSAVENTMLPALSGGEYKLVQIIRQMLRLPDMLIMDEPDVFLDFENLDGLRALINDFPSAILAVTHNRYLLNHCFDKILQIEKETLLEYDGSYMDFCLTQLEMKIALDELSRKESDFITYQEAVVERMRDDATKHDSLKKGKTLHARVSYLERWKARHTEAPYIEQRMPYIRFRPCNEETLNAEYAVKAEKYCILFDRVILDRADFIIKPGEKVALVGANGTGKTTLLNDLWLERTPKLTYNPQLKCKYLSQFQNDAIGESSSVRDVMESVGLGRLEDAVKYLSFYNFSPDMLYHKIGTLSGGERNLLQLAMLSIMGGDLLLLDEPTSHLDLRAQLALEKAIADYNGTVLMVSHDFYTISSCMDYVLCFSNGTVRRMSTRAFRKMVYKNHFPLEYLDLEKRKKELELNISSQLRRGKYDACRALCEELENVVAEMQRLTSR